MDEMYEMYYEDPMSAAKGHSKRPAASDNDYCYRNLNETHVESESDVYVNGGGPYEKLRLDKDHCTDVYAQLHPASKRETEKQRQCFTCIGNVTKAVVVALIIFTVILVIVAMATTALVFVINLQSNLKAVHAELSNIETTFGELNMQVASNITNLENRLDFFKLPVYPSFNYTSEHCQEETESNLCSDSGQNVSLQWSCSSSHIQLNQTVSSLNRNILTTVLLPYIDRSSTP